MGTGKEKVQAVAMKRHMIQIGIASAFFAFLLCSFTLTASMIIPPPECQVLDSGQCKGLPPIYTNQPLLIMWAALHFIIMPGIALATWHDNPE